MKFVFVDETSDVKFANYLGLCVATIDAYSYAALKSASLKVLQGIDWDPSVEFKGSYLFSRSKGCSDVQVEQRVEAAGQLLDLNVATKNSRMKFAYCKMQSSSHGEDYLAVLPELVSKAVKTPRKGGRGKNLILVHCDERRDVNAADLHEAVAPTLERSGFVVVERIAQVASSFETVGVMFADLVGYLAGRVDTIGSDSELFEGLTPEQFERSGKIRKLRTSSELIQKIKALDLYTATVEDAESAT